LLREKLDSLGFRYQYLDGSTAAVDRGRAVRAFQSGEGDFFLLSLKAGAFGMNLTAADYVIIADPWWNPAVEDQAAGRAHRMGQQRPVTVYRLVIKDSVEERIMSLHRDKRALAEGLFSGEEFGKALSVEELAALLRGS
jgi:SNF2 family DNA or RNA helicase